MRSSKSRSRNKSNRQRSLGNIVNRVFDSSGPEGKVRGTPQQIIDKYLMLARDAQVSSDRVAEQAFLQHAEHYTRMLGEAQRELAREQEQRQAQGQAQGGQQGGGNQGGQPYGQNGNGNGYGGQAGGERYEPRDPGEEEQPGLPPSADMADEEDGPGLVETPEMYHAPEPVGFEGAVPGFLGGRAPQERRDEPRGEGKATGGGRREGGRGPRRERSEKPAPAGEAKEGPGRGPRGPRRPRGEDKDTGGAADAPAAPATSDDE